MKIIAVRPDFAYQLVNKGDSGIHPVFSDIFIRRLKIKQNIMQTLTYNKQTKQVLLYNGMTTTKGHVTQTFEHIVTINFGGDRISGYNGQNVIVFSVPHAITNVIYL